MTDSRTPSPSAIPASLFINHEGKPIQFRMRPSIERVRLQPYVRAGGGRLSNATPDSQTILLVPPGDVTHEENAVSSYYLWACIRARRMVCMKEFHVPINTRAPTEDPSCSQETAPSSALRQSKGRNLFTSGDDERIVAFLRKARICDYQSLAEMFRVMSNEFGSHHTWESLKNRVNRQIIPNLYKLLNAKDLKHVSSLLRLDSSSKSSESSSDEDLSDKEIPLKLSIANLPKPISGLLAFGEINGWTYEQSAVLLWMTSGHVDNAKAIIEGKKCSTLLWSPSMDEQLTSGSIEIIDTMLSEYGESELLSRLLFLEDGDEEEDQYLQDLIF